MASVNEIVLDISPLTNKWKKEGWSDEKILKATEDVSRITKNTILFDCEGFYKIFKNLLPLCFLVIPKSKEDFEKVFENEKMFDALVMNGAFAAELAMKYLFFRDNECSFKSLRGHDLYELYYKIPQSDRNIIQDKLETGKRLENKTVDESIKELRNHFVDFRYAFERFDGLGINVFFKTFVCTICDYALGFDNGE